MNMVEKVARAMMVAKNGGDYWDEMSDDSDVDYVGRTEALKMARAAIEAMREPTDAMKLAADRAMTGVFYWNYEVKDESASGAVIYSAMIDKALDERS